MLRTFSIILLSVMVSGFLGLGGVVSAQKKKRAVTQPKISLAEIKSDIVGKSVQNVAWEETDGNPTVWNFAANEVRDIEILKAVYGKEHAAVTVTLYSKLTDSRPDGLWMTVNGNLRLQYDRVVGGWLLTDVENISFKYAIRDAEGRKQNAYQISQKMAPQETVREQSPPPASLTSLVDNSFVVAPGRHQYYTFTVTNQGTVSGTFSAQGGGGNDIKVYILDADGYVNFRNGHPVNTYYNSGKVTVGTINSIVLGRGTYYLVFDNGYSIMSNKAVTASVNVQYE